MTAAQPEDKWIDANGINLHYLDWGNPTAPPMILLHGFCSYAHYWDFFALGLRQEYHILAPDLRGHGDSSRAQSYTLQNSALDLEELIKALNLNDIVLIGLSLGGLISILYTATHPDTVSKLIIVDSGPEFAAEGIEHIQRDLANEPGIFDYEDEVFQFLKQTQPLSSDAFIKHQVKHALERDEAGRLRFKYDKALCQIDLNSPEWLWDYLERISCPTLVVRAADSDMLTIETAQKMVTKSPRGSLTEIPHSGHTVVGDNPEGFEAAVRRFLGVRG